MSQSKIIFLVALISLAFGCGGTTRFGTAVSQVEIGQESNLDVISDGNDNIQNGPRLLVCLDNEDRLGEACVPMCGLNEIRNVAGVCVPVQPVCDVARYDIFNGKCLERCQAGQHRDPQTEACVISQCVNGALDAGTCQNCGPSRHLENGQCLSDTRACVAQPENSVDGMEIWSSNKWQACANYRCINDFQKNAAGACVSMPTGPPSFVSYLKRVLTAWDDQFYEVSVPLISVANGIAAYSNGDVDINYNLADGTYTTTSGPLNGVIQSEPAGGTPIAFVGNNFVGNIYQVGGSAPEQITCQVTGVLRGSNDVEVRIENTTIPLFRHEGRSLNFIHNLAYQNGRQNSISAVKHFHAYGPRFDYLGSLYSTILGYTFMMYNLPGDLILGDAERFSIPNIGQANDHYHFLVRNVGAVSMAADWVLEHFIARPELAPEPLRDEFNKAQGLKWTINPRGTLSVRLERMNCPRSIFVSQGRIPLR